MTPSASHTRRPTSPIYGRLIHIQKQKRAPAAGQREIAHKVAIAAGPLRKVKMPNRGHIHPYKCEQGAKVQ